MKIVNDNYYGNGIVLKYEKGIMKDNMERILIM